MHVSPAAKQRRELLLARTTMQPQWIFIRPERRGLLDLARACVFGCAVCMRACGWGKDVHTGMCGWCASDARVFIDVAYFLRVHALFWVRHVCWRSQPRKHVSSLSFCQANLFSFWIFWHERGRPSFPACGSFCSSDRQKVKMLRGCAFCAKGNFFLTLLKLREVSSCPSRGSRRRAQNSSQSFHPVAGNVFDLFIPFDDGVDKHVSGLTPSAFRTEFARCHLASLVSKFPKMTRNHMQHPNT